MKRWLFGLLVILVVWIIFRTRREYYPTIPFNTDQLTNLQHPGYGSTPSVSLKAAAIPGLTLLTKAPPTVSDYNAIVTAISTLTLTQYSSVPSFTADSSGTPADRLVMRAIAYWPFQMYKIASNVSLSAYNLNTSGTVGSVTTAAQVLLDIITIVSNSGSGGTVTNINNALQSGMTGFRTTVEFFNYFGWTPTTTVPFDPRISYLLNFVTATLGQYYQTTISGWQLDPTYNPLALGSGSKCTGGTCSTGLTCTGTPAVCATSTCANTPSMICPSGQICTGTPAACAPSSCANTPSFVCPSGQACYGTPSTCTSAANIPCNTTVNGVTGQYCTGTQSCMLGYGCFGASTTSPLVSAFSVT